MLGGCQTLFYQLQGFFVASEHFIGFGQTQKHTDYVRMSSTEYSLADAQQLPVDTQ